MAFSEANIIPPQEVYGGLTYGDLIGNWWNYIVTLADRSPTQMGRLLYLLGNVEGEDPSPPSQPPVDADVFTDVAVFFPVLCEVVAVKDHPQYNTEIKRRMNLQNTLANPVTLKANINGYSLSGIESFSKYYTESSDFILDVPKNSKLRTKFDPPLKVGSGRAVGGGYFLLIRPPNKATTYKIRFEGENRNGYHVRASYDVHFIKRP